MGSWDPIKILKTDRKGAKDEYIYGSSREGEWLRSALDRAEPLRDVEKNYTCITDEASFLDALKDAAADLVIVAAGGEPGRRAIQAAKERAGHVPRLWLTDALDDVLEGYRMECLWCILKPPHKDFEELLTMALEKFMLQRGNNVITFPQGGNEYEAE